jgi:hypothetical protein
MHWDRKQESWFESHLFMKRARPQSTYRRPPSSQPAASPAAASTIQGPCEICGKANHATKDCFKLLAAKRDGHL